MEFKEIVDRICAALGPERTIVFKQLLHVFNLKAADPELLVGMAVASMLVDVKELIERTEAMGGTLTDAAKSVSAAMSTGSDSLAEKIDLEVSKAVARALDSMSEELRRLARELALNEVNAAGLARQTAIDQETKALIAAARDYAKNEHAAKVAAASPTAVAERSGPTWLQAGMVGFVAFLVGMAVILMTHHR